MSKIEELRHKYPTITKATFNKFVEADRTKTKKYLEYYCKVWINKKEYNFPGSSSELIYVINEFEANLPYIQNKDIYSQYYNNVKNLYSAVDAAIQLKEEKTFVKEGNVEILEENDDYILLRPLTHTGSVKYGANTKWCTAGRNSEHTFESYFNGGYLAYLISKNIMGDANYQKVAFYCQYDAFFGQISSYNTLDKEFHSSQMITAGWKEEEVYKVITRIRGEAFNWMKVKTAKQKTKQAMLALTSINFDELKQNLTVIEKSKDFDYISSVQTTINEFIEKLKI